MSIAVYVRVSTSDQNVEGQRMALEGWLGGREAEWYVDHAGGDDLDRPAFELLQQDIARGNVRTVVVWKLDRLSRSLTDGLNVLATWCEQGIRVVSVTQQIDFSGAGGKMLAAVLLGLAEMEQETRRERQAAGIVAARRAGKYKGRKPGSTKGNPRRAKELREYGMSQSEIAAALAISKSTVRRYLNA